MTSFQNINNDVYKKPKNIFESGKLSIKTDDNIPKLKKPIELEKKDKKKLEKEKEIKRKANKKKEKNKLFNRYRILAKRNFKTDEEKNDNDKIKKKDEDKIKKKNVYKIFKKRKKIG